MRNIRLTIAYDGTDYVGWQVQPNGPSVQAAVQRAIGQLTGETGVTVLAAGRTDSGVHALGQVANFHTNSPIPTEKFQQALQSFLPEDVVLREAVEVAEDFHATYSAVKKRYRYAVLNAELADPLMRRYAWHYHGRLDVEAMHGASQALVGEHDFRCFETQFPNRASSVRTVLEAGWGRHDAWPLWSRRATPPAAGANDGSFLWFDIVADGFLYNMVRTIVGTLVRVGRGSWDTDDVRRIIAGQDRSLAGDTAPARGLYLVAVDYEVSEGAAGFVE